MQAFLGKLNQCSHFYHSMEDSHKHQGLRLAMVQELRLNGRYDEAVLKAMESVPRHAFVDSALAELAYQNKALPIGCDQTISHPATVAAQSSLLKVAKNMRILEIGTGCGYQSAVLAKLGAQVFSIERQRDLHLKAKKVLNILGLKIHSVYGDGFKGLPSIAPFDAILVTCGAEQVPEGLLQQLKIGGTMVIPLGKVFLSQRMKRFTRLNANDFDQEDFGEFNFVPMLNNRN